jgi:hypothetical protein
MDKSSYLSSKNSRIIAFLLSLSTTISGLNLAPASAQVFRYPPNSSGRNNSPTIFNSSSSFNIPAGTTVPLSYDGAEKILVTREETLPLTLKVAANIRDRQGRILIPYGTEVVGQIQPAENGSQFVAQYLVLNQNQQKPINASSRIITTTEVIEEGADAGSIIQGAAIGSAAAIVIAAITGDQAIATEEVLIGTGLGALGGWIWGGTSVELISIDPNNDLDLTFF